MDVYCQFHCKISSPAHALIEHLLYFFCLAVRALYDQFVVDLEYQPGLKTAAFKFCRYRIISRYL